MWASSGDGDDVFDDDVIIRMPYDYSHPNCTGSIFNQNGGQ